MNSKDNRVYKKTWFIVLMLVLIMPVGLVLMFRSQQASKIARSTMTVLAPIIMIAVLSACATNDVPDKDVPGVKVDQEADGDVDEAVSDSKKLAGMQVDFIDVGQADAALIQYDEYTILIDSGDWNGNETVTYLKDKGVNKIDLMVGSHPHSDHIGQFDKVIENFEVGEVWMAGGIATTQVFERVMTAIDNKDIDYEEPRTGDHYEIGELVIDILSPESITGNLNDDSIVMKLTYGDVTFLFTGDAETPAEKKMVSSGKDLSSTILKAGHHGSDTSTTQAFLDKVDPEVVIISAAEKSRYNHPNKTVLDRLNAKDLKLYATKTHGNIVINTDGKTYEVSKDREGEVIAGDIGAKTPDKDPSETEDAETDKTQDKVEVSTGCIDINTASEDELATIKHIGPATATKVVAARPFTEVSELSKVSGLGSKKVADIEDEDLACMK